MFKDNLISLRKIHGYSQDELAEKIGVTRQTLSKYEIGYTTPSIYQLVAICHALNIKEGPSYFMEKSVLHGFW